MKLIAIITPKGFQIDFDYNSKGSLSIIEENFIEAYNNNLFKALYELSLENKKSDLSPSMDFLYKISKSITTGLIKNPQIEFARENINFSLDNEEITRLVSICPYIIGSEYLNNHWIELIVSELVEVFKNDIKDFVGTVDEYFSKKGCNLHIPGRIYFHLVESKKEEYPFAFLATYAQLTEIKGKVKHIPLKNALIEYKNDNDQLLRLLATVNKATEKSSFISEIMESGEIFHPLAMSIEDAYTFLKEIPIYEESGILCRIPNWWKQKSNALKLNVSVGNNPSFVGQEALMDFDLNIALGEDTLTKKEIEQLMAENEGLAFLKGKWVEVNHEKLQQVLLAYEQAETLMESKDLSMIEAMKLQLNAHKLLKISEHECDINVTEGQWFDDVLNNLKNPEKINEVSCGNNFNASLRNYQKQGLSWLYYMKQLGLGACLADDMGLGKTIQVIALLNYLKENKKDKSLLIIPASLLGNWEKELIKFAPEIKYYILHSSKTKVSQDYNEDFLKDYQVIITTYTMISKQVWLHDINWDLLILDEAQAIKNAGSIKTKTAKKIKSSFRIAMTGTPIENSLSDLWSLFDFLNSGLLGTSKEFSLLVKQLKENPEGNKNLKKVVSPFILRRIKTDKSIINDLPDKVEMKSFANLTKKQGALYASLVKDLNNKLNDSEGIARKGLILSSLMKFKQICNHPDQYLGENLFIENESGKFARLREICETVYERRERILVFTQFKEMTEPLNEFLETIFHHKGRVIHGGTPVKKRQQIVDDFQGEDYVPFMVLSLKAGGVGLNLTAANHVVHFDRWWNPAVENQATDRAFRIGQKKNVIVHKFITQGTIEEKIDLLMEEKTKLSQEIISTSQENWITEMSNSELLELFKLAIPK
ncbi:DEAD/DEAH box helicase [Clostridium grantii]|uniref:Non-specific serine/threonine protein kinase n=1 Tax=Clostridium grantii DSM 8605 TaxID=1121316 RepID=A0A1M5RIX2_9CLOT|nr:DEAD/DEAH box helicase [Clostridium grantii]SHH26211.1 non-specific serine/threonine protein kinase [Clostridium grantii DSM 8605]